MSIDNDRNPKRLQEYASGGARGRSDVAAKVVRELDEEMPAAASRTVHQHPLASSGSSRSTIWSAVPPASGSAAASSADSVGGRRATKAASATTSSAYAPQRVPRTGSSPQTSSPGSRSQTARPTARTSPANS